MLCMFCEHGVFMHCVGQYTGTSKPMPEYHTKIISFNDTVSLWVLFALFKLMEVGSSLDSYPGPGFDFHHVLCESLKWNRQDQMRLFLPVNVIFQCSPNISAYKLTP